MKKVLVVAAHPDDEILGVGGCLLKHIANGDQVYWLVITNVFEDQGFSKELVDGRQKEISEVYERAGFSGIFKLDFPTMSLSSESLLTLIPKISDVVNEVQPEVIYTMNRSDAHSDHRIIFDAVAACTKSFRYPFVKQFIMYETISETEFGPALPENRFVPNYFVDISDFLEQKIELMKIYESEMGEHPFPRSIENIRALSTYRGAFAGVRSAEAFQLVHKIDK